LLFLFFHLIVVMNPHVYFETLAAYQTWVKQKAGS
jgi:hypothetical protein